jgi:hypothetical protein
LGIEQDYCVAAASHNAEFPNLKLQTQKKIQCGNRRLGFQFSIFKFPIGRQISPFNGATAGLW